MQDVAVLRTSRAVQDSPVCLPGCLCGCLCCVPASVCLRPPFWPDCKYRFCSELLRGESTKNEQFGQRA